MGGCNISYIQAYQDESIDIKNIKVQSNAIDEIKKDSQVEQGCSTIRQFTFSWSFTEACNMTPRGGTTRGAKIILDSEVHPGWLSLKNPKLKRFEKDRAAIMAMAGPYRTSFDFLEVVGYQPNFVPDNPYQSWGTEYVYLIEDSPKFIRLQHIMVMQFIMENGELSDPMVMKHWRQDWEYEPKELLEYVGNNTWKKRKLKRNERKGRWAQSVYQVDDSPRYSATGIWEHTHNFSSWKSDSTWRPLPRRERSVRQDYQVLEGFNRHTIVPNGWVQEEENLKLILKDHTHSDKKGY